jgi:isopenicillin N synthase-like dioxygenase
VDDLPVIDISDLAAAAPAIDRACRDRGFFLVEGHGADLALLAEVDAAARELFGRPTAEKQAIAMERGGRAWRGWFPEGGELTAGRPDHKEGLYFGEELSPTDPRVVAGLPLHGPNVFPEDPAELRPAVLAWMEEMTAVGHRVASGVAQGLGLPADWFDRHLTAHPTTLFRIFRYPPRPPDDDGWGVAEHTDYGLLTLLAHDGTPGLQVRATHGGWLDVPAVDGALVVNLGDMLERMTAGAYRSTPHRVRHASDGTTDRLSFPFFFDPAWDAEIRPVPGTSEGPPTGPEDRWDGRSVHEWTGTYGDYLTAKVVQVFPALAAEL